VIAQTIKFPFFFWAAPSGAAFLLAIRRHLKLILRHFNAGNDVWVP
jgi:hypothetical protein